MLIRDMQSVSGTPYEWDQALAVQLDELAEKVAELRKDGALSPQVLHHLRKHFRLKDIYHSNAIEGNVLSLGETRQVLETGVTITGKPLKDSLEAKNLGHALDFFEELVTRHEPISELELRQIHSLILAGIDDDNAGRYRSTRVQITGSQFEPPGPEEVTPRMAELGDWLKNVSVPESRLSQSPILVAAAAHAWLVYIHPFADGNGRTARILMNLMLMRYGYPIAIITKDDRDRYYDALEETQSTDLSPFAGLVVESVLESLEEYMRAAQEQRASQEWAQSLVATLGERELTKVQREYEVWKAAMDLLRSYFRQTTFALAGEAMQTGVARIFFKDFGMLEFEKYLALRRGESAKRTWFFRIDFRAGDRSARYLFFFGFGSRPLAPQCPVTVHMSREESPFFYQKLDLITSSDVPDLREIGFDAEREVFVFRQLEDTLSEGSIERIGKKFIEEIARTF